jgi:4-diphosphocytidyl-2-C-methyl-D-erythritol kinase
MAQAAKRFASPAKLNVGLHILGKRPDGYHAIETIFQMLDRCDWLTIHPHDEGTIQLTCRPATLPTDEQNLVVRAARLLRQVGNVHAGATITLEKHIPIAAGLGGGSSDAATTLLALNLLWDLHFPSSTLHRLAAQLGSDVPFFLGGATALGRGRGEILAPLPPIPPLSGLLVNPGFGISTAWAYGQFAGRSQVATPSMGSVAQALQRQDLTQLSDILYNDLEPGVVATYPVILQMREALQAAGAVVTFMTGSGPTVCGLFPHVTNLQAASLELSRRHEWSIIPFTTLSCSPHTELQG